MTPNDPLDLPTCRREVEELHDFFEAWFRGTHSKSEAHYARVRSALAPTFHLISPDARVLTRAEVLDWIWEMHGTRREDRLWVDELQLRALHGDVAVVTYREWQETPAGRTLRLSTALLARAAGTPNGLSWLHVHESWIEKG